jgi:dCTP deaminase
MGRQENRAMQTSIQLPLRGRKENGAASSELPRHKFSGNKGVLPNQAIEDLVKRHAVRGLNNGEIDPDQIQPASIDLRLGSRCYRVRASFLPGRERTVEETLEEFSIHEMRLDDGAVLERGCFYVAELQEVLTLPENVSAVANPKSSTGRLDVFTRLISDKSEVFDWVNSGYQGRLYVEICPMTFSIKVAKGSRLNQMRFLRRTSRQHRYDRPEIDDNELERIHKEQGLVAEGLATIRNGLNVRVELNGNRVGAIIGYKAQKCTGVIDLEKKAAHSRSEFWDPIYSNKQGRLILDPEDFYILASKERMQVPPAFAAEMAPIDPMMGEFRAHYAGFFDPGFGHMPKGPHGSKAVLEVRSHGVPFVLEDGQIIARLVYERLTESPTRLYGQGLKSHYQGQGLKLSKHFR